MSLSEYFPIWPQLTSQEREILERAAVVRSEKRGTILHYGAADCIGLFVLRSGQLRAFLLSESGREITLYRLFDRDICLFSASCMLPNIQFDVMVEAETDSTFWVIPTAAYQQVTASSAAAANFTNQLMASRFTEVMWLVDQVLSKSFDARLAEFLLEERRIEGGDTLSLTHDKIARHLGTAREVVTRMLRYFQSEGMVALSRGEITILDAEKLKRHVK
jgi:CRP/FNR family transcriptional regulator